jgi:hypothetical protein
MNRLALFAIAIAATLGASATWMAAAERDSGTAFVNGGAPVTEDQVRQEMLAEGYSNPQILRQGRYFEAMGTKDGQMQKLVIDSWTGLLRSENGDDEDSD